MIVARRTRPPDTTWRPQPGIRVIAIGVVRKDDRRETLHGSESNGQPFVTRWIEIDRAQRGEVTVYPDGLLELLAGEGR